MPHEIWIKPSVSPALLRQKAEQLGQAILRDDALCIERIAVRGVSGLVMGGVVSYYTGIPLVIIRKPDEQRHSIFPVEYDGEFSRYCIIDDLVASGRTLNQIIESLPNRTLVKVYLYETRESTDAELPSWIYSSYPALRGIPVQGTSQKE